MQRLILLTPELEGLVASTVDAFQGAEASFIIFLMTTTEVLGFMRSPNRLLVALSRARDGLAFVCNYESFMAGEHPKRKRVLDDVARHCKAIGAYVEMEHTDQPEEDQDGFQDFFHREHLVRQPKEEDGTESTDNMGTLEPDLAVRRPYHTA
ncbi:MAG: hypothetical protein Q9196_000963 [Gyalolechia fulgens]